MRRFFLVREIDESGCSGTGIVAQGMEFDSGRAVMEWLVPPCSLNIFASVDELVSVHGHCGKSKVQFIDDLRETQTVNGARISCQS
jgi:hypothetical protein